MWLVHLVEAAGFELTLHDPPVTRGLGVVPSYVVEELLRVLATDEYLDRITERMVEVFPS